MKIDVSNYGEVTHKYDMDALQSHMFALDNEVIDWEKTLMTWLHACAVCDGGCPPDDYLCGSCRSQA